MLRYRYFLVNLGSMLWSGNLNLSIEVVEMVTVKDLNVLIVSSSEDLEVECAPKVFEDQKKKNEKVREIYDRVFVSGGSRGWFSMSTSMDGSRRLSSITKLRHPSCPSGSRKYQRS